MTEQFATNCAGGSEGELLSLHVCSVSAVGAILAALQLLLRGSGTCLTAPLPLYPRSCLVWLRIIYCFGVPVVMR